MTVPWQLRLSRAAYLRGMVVGGAALAAGAAVGPGDALWARADTPSAPCGDSAQSIINTALIAEQLAITFYYTALTTPDIVSDYLLAGSSADPNHPSLPPGGNPGNVRILQAALDTEIKHAAALADSGGQSTATHFFFPAATFKAACSPGQLCTLGSSSDPTTFLGVLDVLETAFIGAYLAGVYTYARIGRPDLAELAASIVGVEAEHRALGRVIADSRPSNNLTLEALPFACMSDAGGILAPFLTGADFPHGATPPIPLPSSAQTAKVVGKFNTRIVPRFV